MTHQERAEKWVADWVNFVDDVARARKVQALADQFAEVEREARQKWLIRAVSYFDDTNLATTTIYAGLVDAVDLAQRLTGGLLRPVLPNRMGLRDCPHGPKGTAHEDRDLECEALI